MDRRIALATLLVRDYDEALAFFTGALGFTVAEDEPLDAARQALGDGRAPRRRRRPAARAGRG